MAVNVSHIQKGREIETSLGVCENLTLEQLREVHKKLCLFDRLYDGLQASLAIESGAQGGSGPQDDVYYVSYELMLGGLNLQQQCFQAKADELRDNSNMQLNTLKEQAKLKYHDDFPDDSDKEYQKKINEMQAYNQRIDAQKALLQNSVVSMRQSASTKMAQTNALVSSMTQKGAMTSAFIRALNTVFEDISGMLKPRG